MPSPSATTSEVSNFLAAYLHRAHPQLSQAIIKERAERIGVDGEQLYEMSVEQWKEIYGLDGELIFEMLQRSEYGYVS